MPFSTTTAKGRALPDAGEDGDKWTAHTFWPGAQYGMIALEKLSSSQKLNIEITLTATFLLKT